MSTRASRVWSCIEQPSDREDPHGQPFPRPHGSALDEGTLIDGYQGGSEHGIMIYNFRRQYARTSPVRGVVDAWFLPEKVGCI